MRIQINPEGVPIYQQIADQVRYRIVSKQLIVGDELPSIRCLAQTIRVNPNTVAKAYRELENEGFLEKRRTKGTFVAQQMTELTLQQRTSLITPQIDAIIAYASRLGLSPPQLVDLIQSRERTMQDKASTKREEI